MKIKIRYENEYQTLEVENVELERWLNISISENESQEDYEQRIQDVIEERFNRPDYNSWHKHDRHTGNAYIRTSFAIPHRLITWSTTAVSGKSQNQSPRVFPRT